MSKGSPQMILTPSPAATDDVESATLISPARNNNSFGRNALLAVLAIATIVAIGATASAATHGRAAATAAAKGGKDTALVYLFEHVDETDISAYEAAFDDESALTWAMGSGSMTRTGVAELMAANKMFLEVFPGLSGEVKDSTVVGNKVVIQVDYGTDDIAPLPFTFVATIGKNGIVKEGTWYGDFGFAFATNADVACQAATDEFSAAVNALDMDTAYSHFDLSAKQCTAGLGCQTWADNKAFGASQVALGGKIDFKFDVVKAMNGGCGFMGRWTVTFPDGKAFTVDLGGWSELSNGIVGNQKIIAHGIEDLYAYVQAPPQDTCAAVVAKQKAAFNGNVGEMSSFFSSTSTEPFCMNGDCMPMAEAFTNWNMIMSKMTLSNFEATTLTTLDGKCATSFTVDYAGKAGGTPGTASCTTLDTIANGVYTSSSMMCSDPEAFIASALADPCADRAANYQAAARAGDADQFFINEDFTSTKMSSINGQAVPYGEAAANFKALFPTASYADFTATGTAIDADTCSFQFVMTWTSTTGSGKSGKMGYGLISNIGSTGLVESSTMTGYGMEEWFANAAA